MVYIISLKLYISMTKVNQQLFDQYVDFTEALAGASEDPPQGDKIIQIEAQVEEWAKTNNVDLTEPVELDTGAPCPPGQHKDPNGNCVPDATGDLDKYGIKKIHKDGGAQGFWDDVSYKRSLNNQSNEKNIPRDTFTIDLKGKDPPAYEISYYATVDFKKADQESNKNDGGTHSDKNAKAGRCYGLGCTSDGDPHLEKEYPKHPTTPKFYKKVKLADPNFKNIGNVKGKSIGFKIIKQNKNNKTVFFEVWVDTTGMVNGQPANNWKLWWTAEDDGTWAGDPYLKNQGLANNDKALDQLRIDHVGKKTELYGRSVREIDAL
jgi:hypothetical protein